MIFIIDELAIQTSNTSTMQQLSEDEDDEKYIN